MIFTKIFPKNMFSAKKSQMQKIIRTEGNTKLLTCEKFQPIKYSNSYLISLFLKKLINKYHNCAALCAQSLAFIVLFQSTKKKRVK